MMRTLPVAPVASGSTRRSTRARRRPGPYPVRHTPSSMLASVSMHGPYHDGGATPLAGCATIGFELGRPVWGASVAECHPRSGARWICAGSGSMRTPWDSARAWVAPASGLRRSFARWSDSRACGSVIRDLDKRLISRGGGSGTDPGRALGLRPRGVCWYTACIGSGRMGLGLSRPDHSRDRAPAHHREKMREAALRGSATGHAAQHDPGSAALPAAWVRQRVQQCVRQRRSVFVRFSG